MTSSSQSVAGQPVASPEPMPAHHGFMPVAAILSDSVDHLVPGGRDGPALLREHLRRVPDEGLHVRAQRRRRRTCRRRCRRPSSPRRTTCRRCRTTDLGASFDLAGVRDQGLAAGRAAGRYAMSGGLPLLTRTTSWASNSLEPSYLTVAPVQVSKSLYESFCGLVLGGDDGGVDRDVLAGQVAELRQLSAHSGLPLPGRRPAGGCSPLAAAAAATGGQDEACTQNDGERGVRRDVPSLIACALLPLSTRSGPGAARSAGAPASRVTRCKRLRNAAATGDAVTISNGRSLGHGMDSRLPTAALRSRCVTAP